MTQVNHLDKLDKLTANFPIRTLFWILAIVLGILHNWANRFTMNPDGVSYLDIGDAYFRGDWSEALNGYWSPLYSWLLGFAMAVIKPSAYWEFPVAKLVNFFIYLVALVCFEFFLNQLIVFYQERRRETSQSRYFEIPQWMWLTLGYTLFIWSFLYWLWKDYDQRLCQLTPDGCVAALVYLATGIILRVRTQSASWASFILLGVILGLAYLAKAVMFPLSFVFLVVSFFSVENRRQALSRVVVAFVVFLIVAMPFCAALSMAKGHFTFGDTGKLNYVWYTNGIDRPYVHWQGAQPETGTPKHPVRQIFDAPVVFEFGTPVGGTYPLWYDPSYWYEGIKSRFDFKGEIRALKTSFAYVANYIGAFLLVYLVLAYFSNRLFLAIALKDLIENWRLLVPAFVGTAVYLPVWIEIRYFAPFLILLCVGALASLRLPNTQESKRLMVGITLAVFVGATYNFSALTIGNLKASFQETIHTEWLIADQLNSLGIRPGDQVARIGEIPGNYWGGYWARLAKVKIIAEVDTSLKQEINYWKADASIQDRVLEVLKQSEVKAVVAEKIPDDFSAVGWHSLKGTSFHIRFLSQ